MKTREIRILILLKSCLLYESEGNGRENRGEAGGSIWWGFPPPSFIT